MQMQKNIVLCQAKNAFLQKEEKDRKPVIALLLFKIIFFAQLCLYLLNLECASANNT